MQLTRMQNTLGKSQAMSDRTATVSRLEEVVSTSEEFDRGRLTGAADAVGSSDGLYKTIFA